MAPLASDYSSTAGNSNRFGVLYLSYRCRTIRSMASSERQQYDTSSPPTLEELTTALNEVNEKLEITDENENPIERLLKRDQLLEEQDGLQDQIDELTLDQECRKVN